jgi:hypothetical protein
MPGLIIMTMLRPPKVRILVPKIDGERSKTGKEKLIEAYLQLSIILDLY